MKKIKELFITLCVFISIMSLPGIYYLVYLHSINPDIPYSGLLTVSFLIICHIVTGKLIYDVYINKYSPKYHDKEKGGRIIPPLKKLKSWTELQALGSFSRYKRFSQPLCD